MNISTVATSFKLYEELQEVIIQFLFVFVLVNICSFFKKKKIRRVAPTTIKLGAKVIPTSENKVCGGSSNFF